MSKEGKTAGIVLAAGQSKRLGHAKQLVRYQKRSLINIVMEAAITSSLDDIIVVLGHNHKQIRRQLKPFENPSNMVVVINTNFKAGLSRSIQTGLDYVDSHHQAAMFILGDQPLINKFAIDALIDQYIASSKGICQPVCGERRGNPTIFHRRYFQMIHRLSGDTGARHVIQAHPRDVHLFETKDPAYFFDIDTQKDINKLAKLEYTPLSPKRWPYRLDG